MRVHVCAVRMTLHRADVLEAYLNGQDMIQKATVYERTGDVVLTYRGSRKDAAALLAAYRFDNEELEVLVTSRDSRKINQEYQEKMVSLVAGRVFRKVFLPAPIAAAYTVWRSIAFVWKGVRCLLHRKLEVEVLDALSITASLLRGDYSTAGSVMFLLTVGSLLEEWTRKKSLDDLVMQQKISMKVDTSAIEQEIANYEKQLRQSYSVKVRLMEEIDSLDPDDKHYIKRKADLDDRLYKMYDKIEDTENQLVAARAKKMAIEAEKLTGDNIYKVLIYFDKLYSVMDDQEKRQLMESLLSEVQIYEERQPNGQWLKSIKFKLPIIAEDMSLSLDNDAHIETV